MFIPRAGAEFEVGPFKYTTANYNFQEINVTGAPRTTVHWESCVFRTLNLPPVRRRMKAGSGGGGTNCLKSKSIPRPRIRFNVVDAANCGRYSATFTHNDL